MCFHCNLKFWRQKKPKNRKRIWAQAAGLSCKRLHSCQRRVLQRTFKIFNIAQLLQQFWTFCTSKHGQRQYGDGDGWDGSDGLRLEIRRCSPLSWDFLARHAIYRQLFSFALCSQGEEERCEHTSFANDEVQTKMELIWNGCVNHCMASRRKKQSWRLDVIRMPRDAQRSARLTWTGSTKGDKKPFLPFHWSLDAGFRAKW